MLGDSSGHHACNRPLPCHALALTNDPWYSMVELEGKGEAEDDRPLAGSFRMAQSERGPGDPRLHRRRNQNYWSDDTAPSQIQGATSVGWRPCRLTPSTATVHRMQLNRRTSVKYRLSSVCVTPRADSSCELAHSRWS